MNSNARAQLYPESRDISKTWFIKYYDCNNAPQKKYINSQKFPTEKERLQRADELFVEIEKSLLENAD
ncbi:MAG TPA: hypothetical protein PL045_13580, partial [Chitinophagaceae bacterium]|nr:hypothetical protein [Chitinophagaceae bacterium]